jgi:hypothetical protein
MQSVLFDFLTKEYGFNKIQNLTPATGEGNKRGEVPY